MAIDPSISLSYRPPQFQMPEIQTPLERFAKVLSLQNLMRQGQMGDIELQQARRSMAATEAINRVLRGESPDAQGTVTPPQTMLAPPQQPGTLTGATQFAPVQQPQAQTATPLIGYNPMTGTIPAPPAATAPVPVAPMVSPTPAPAARTGMTLSRLAALGPQLLQAGGMAALPMVENIGKAYKADLDRQISEIELGKKQTGELADLATGAIDNDSFKRNLVTAAQNGHMTWDEVRQRSELGFDHPTNQTWLKSVQLRAVGADKAQEMRLRDVKELRDKWDFEHKQLLAPYQVTEAKAKAGSAELAQTRDQVAQDAMALAQAAQQDQKTVAQGGQPTAVQAVKDKIGADRASHFASATTPAEYLNAGLTASQAVTAAETKRHASVEELISAARFAEEKKKNAAFGDITPAQAAVANRIATQYDNHPLVKDFNTQVTKYASMKNLLDKKLGGPGDVAMIYDFMKALDPNSVVRESEYQSAAKSGNIFSGALARFNGYLKPEGGFLPDKMKQAFLDIVGNRMNVSRDQIGKIYQDYGRRIDQITGQSGTGTDFLTNYGNLYDVGRGGAGGGGIPQNVVDALKAAGPGDHRGADGKWWHVDPDGSMREIAAPAK